jgi:putative flippase GtrA
MTAKLCVRRLAEAAVSGSGGEFLRYFGCSAVALATDLTLFYVTMSWGIGLATAAALGFLAGLGMAYALSVRYAFAARSQSSERFEFAVFASIGLLGLALTEALLWMQVDLLHWHPAAAKLTAAATVFLVNYGLRKALLFTEVRALGVTRA